MYKKVYTIVVFLLCICGFSVFAQNDLVTAIDAANKDAPAKNTVLNTFSVDASRNILLANSTADYRVTPGDVYTLSYAAGTTSVTYVITVDTSYRIRVSNLGVINGAGKTFTQVRNEVETIVTNNYALSGVQLVITQPSVFIVHVNGEVNTAGDVLAWGLSKLSSLANENLTDSASIRNISVKSANGQTRIYDLFKAQRMSDLSQDPYLRPGDIITFNRVNRVVAINGEIERPGRYQILDGENLKALIEIYANGFTPMADPSRIELVRIVNSAEITGDKIFLTEDDLVDNFTLEHYDEIMIPSITQLRAMMFVEGAVTNMRRSLDNNVMVQSSIADAQDITSSNRLIVQFNKGETYMSLVRGNTNWFTIFSDTQNAYILRNNGRIPLNINNILYNVDYGDNTLVQENDVLVIPFRQYFVSVAGAVIAPGRYQYIPDRDWEYYIAMAGGFVAGVNARNSVVITDINGNRMKKTDAITPETIITASSNHALFYFNQYAPVVTTILSLITTFLSLLMYNSR